MKNVLVCLLGLGLMTASIVKAETAAPETSVPSVEAAQGEKATSEGKVSDVQTTKVCKNCQIAAGITDNTAAEGSTSSSGATGTKVEPTK